MGFKETVDRVRVLFEGTSLDSPLPPAYPPAAIEIAPDRITGVRIARDRRGGRPAVRAAVAQALPEGAIDLSLVRPNLIDPGAVGAVLDQVLRAVAPGEHRVSLLLPDPVARVSLLNFQSLPSTRRELAEMVRFRMGKALPFKAEEAAMDLMPVTSAKGTPSAGAVLAVFMHRPILEQYEGLLTARGYWPGLVGLSTLELYNLFRGTLQAGVTDRDVMLLNLTRHALTLLIVSGGQIIFYRCKAHPGGAAAAASFAGVKREIYTSLAFYQEKLLGRGIGKVWVRAAGIPESEAIEAAGAEAGCPVEVLRLGKAVQVAESARLDDAAAAEAAPAAGAAAGRRA
jgi:hypothetical protein